MTDIYKQYLFLVDQFLDRIQGQDDPTHLPILMELRRQHHRLTTPMKRQNQGTVVVRKRNLNMNRPPLGADAAGRFKWTEDLYAWLLGVAEGRIQTAADHYEPGGLVHLRQHLSPNADLLGDTFYNIPLSGFLEQLVILDDVMISTVRSLMDDGWSYLNVSINANYTSKHHISDLSNKWSQWPAFSDNRMVQVYSLDCYRF
jgi:hypothetical protein